MPELRRRGLLPDPPADDKPVTFRERIYGEGQRGLRDDHPGFRYKYDTYEQAVAEDEIRGTQSKESNEK